MTNRKTLALNPEASNAEAPALKKKSRGWEISDSRLDALMAHRLASNPSPQHWSFC